MTTTFLIGLVVALLYTEAAGLLPGGIIVPAYFALYAGQPWRIAATLAAAILSLAAYRLLSGHFLLFGRRRFVFLILCGGFLGQAWILLWPRLFEAPLDLRVVGWVVPGLLANTLARQKFLPTLAATATATVLTYVLARFVFGV